MVPVFLLLALKFKKETLALSLSPSLNIVETKETNLPMVLKQNVSIVLTLTDGI